MEAIIKRYRKQFPKRGTFTFSHGQRIHDVVRKKNVPDEYGAYIVSGPSDQVLYIGRSGTMLKDGGFQAQALRGRLTNRQGKLSRQEFFEKMLAERKIQSLLFEWFITFNETNHVLPCLAESQLFQAYFDCNGKLPPYNEKA